MSDACTEVLSSVEDQLRRTLVGPRKIVLRLDVTNNETLAKAQEIFGPENGDLFVSFKTLLSKHGLT